MQSAFSKPGWFKSSKSGAAGHCVEVKSFLEFDQIGIRDSKNPDGTVLTVDSTTFAAFIDGVKAGEFDYPTA